MRALFADGALRRFSKLPNSMDKLCQKILLSKDPALTAYEPVHYPVTSSNRGISETAVLYTTTKKAIFICLFPRPLSKDFLPGSGSICFSFFVMEALRCPRFSSCCRQASKSAWLGLLARLCWPASQPVKLADLAGPAGQLCWAQLAWLGWPDCGLGWLGWLSWAGMAG